MMRTPLREREKRFEGREEIRVHFRPEKVGQKEDRGIREKIEVESKEEDKEGLGEKDRVPIFTFLCPNH